MQMSKKLLFILSHRQVSKLFRQFWLPFVLNHIAALKCKEFPFKLQPLIELKVNQLFQVLLFLRRIGKLIRICIHFWLVRSACRLWAVFRYPHLATSGPQTNHDVITTKMQ